MTTRITIKDRETDGATFAKANLSAVGNTLTIEAGGERGFVIQLPLEAVKAIIAGSYLLEGLQSAQPEQTDCEYCHEDPDGYVRPIEKNSHAWLVRRGRTMKLYVCFKGGYSECDILFCPMCGRRLTDGRFNQPTGGD